MNLSKLMSYVLRHRPDSVGLTLGEGGWVGVDELVAKCQAHGHRFTREELLGVVAENSKQRFAISEDGLRVRANQGHSVGIDLGYAPAQPPPELFHGTYEGALAKILAEGLSKMSRHHVHLSVDVETARIVGARRGRPVMLCVACCIRAHGRGWPRRPRLRQRRLARRPSARAVCDESLVLTVGAVLRAFV